ncbi:hypothetical protein [Shewanella sp. 10N.286.52.A9]|uniref:hypothetical protein n=1 Tax=Shewanella sp. 10N.286.52.A9 TaxID=3229711 RepID=UPI002618122E|nr:hypothetical protein [uncultured Shewanella sp.]
MIAWFQKTFETAAQQATLFSILVSTCLAIFLLLLNQWFNSRKDIKNLKVTKLEELASATYAYERLCFDILSRLYNNSPSDQITLDKMADSVELSDKIEMLVTLYFPSITFDPKSTQTTLLKVHHQFDMVEINNKSDRSSYESYENSTNTVKEVLSTLKSLVKYEMSKNT